MPSTTFTVRPNAGFSLADLPNLQPGDNLHIKGLENLRNRMDVREPNLSSMRLNRLHLTWAPNTDSAEEEVLEALSPHEGLTDFVLSGYEGMNIPNWMTDISSLACLVDVKLMKCINCRQLPPLGKLNCLTTLYLSQMTNVMYIDDSPYEKAKDKAFPSLREMTLYDLPNLKRVLRIEGVEMLSQLSKLSIQSIPIFELPSLPSVEEVYVGGKTKEFNAHGASFLLRNIAVKMPNLTELMIENFDQIKVLPIELSSLGSLQKLYISCCRNLESIPNMSSSSLQVLSFALCNRLKSIIVANTLLSQTRLWRLQIHYCRKLILPANMNMLTSLREVSIMGADKRRRLYNGLEHIPSLQNLSLTDFPSLRSLPDWLGNTPTLQELEISKFPILTELPENFDQHKNLQKLSIDRCPMLVERLKRTGEDWYKIAHIPIKPDFVDPINEEEYSDSDSELDMEVDDEP